jgi:cold shock CspA family protein
MYKPTNIHMQQDYGKGYIPPEERFKDVQARFEQITTRGDGTLELGEDFKVDDIDFGSALEHIKIHQEGEVAGSQFNGEVIQGSDDLKYLLKKALPSTLKYDQFGRAELTLELTTDKPLGYSGVKSLDEVREEFPDAQFEQKVRTPGGEEDVVDGVEGAWYPETDRDRNVIMEGDKVKNPKARFEPKANIARVPKDKFQEVSKTDKVTVIIQKIQDKPTVLTMFPGENAPAYPAKIDTEGYKADSTGDTKETKFWNQHAFVEAV